MTDLEPATDSHTLTAGGSDSANSFTNSSSSDALSFPETMKKVLKIWTSSMVVKIVSAVVLAILVLTVVFIITTSKYAADDHRCDTDLRTEKEKNVQCASAVSGLKVTKEERQKDITNDDARIRELNDKISSRNAEIKSYNEKIEGQKITINNLNEAHKDLVTKETALRGTVDQLNAQKSQKDTEWTALRREDEQRTAELKTVNSTHQTYNIVAYSSGGVHIVSVIGDIWSHSTLNTATQNAIQSENENHDLKGAIRNLNDSVTTHKILVENLKKEIAHVKELEGTCQADKITKKEDLERCFKDEAALKGRKAIYVDLGLAQAKAQLIKISKSTDVEFDLAFNSSNSGFGKQGFLNIMLERRPTVTIIRTNQQFVFGAYINVSFQPSKEEYKEDKDSFTFSTEHNIVCPIKAEEAKHALRFSEHDLIAFGNHEITVYVEDTGIVKGNVHADSSYSCNAADPSKFYADGTDFLVTEILVYQVRTH